MDDLLIFGAVILFCGLVVGPLVAIAALRRSAAVRVELAALQRRVEELELRGVAQAPGGGHRRRADNVSGRYRG
jgi:hypothetical protein